jgi:hypothetical protein
VTLATSVAIVARALLESLWLVQVRLGAVFELTVCMTTRPAAEISTGQKRVVPKNSAC